MLDLKILKSNKITVTFDLIKPHITTRHTVRGRVAQTICWLAMKGKAGVTAAEMSCWALRLGAYIHILRHKYGVNILTEWEAHDGGKHGRYVLQEMVTIISVKATTR